MYTNIDTKPYAHTTVVQYHCSGYGFKTRLLTDGKMGEECTQRCRGVPLELIVKEGHKGEQLKRRQIGRNGRNLGVKGVDRKYSSPGRW